MFLAGRSATKAGFRNTMYGQGPWTERSEAGEEGLNSPSLAAPYTAAMEPLGLRMSARLGAPSLHQTETGFVPCVDAREREIDEDVGGAELPVDHRAVADAAAGPHIAFQQ